MKSYSIQEINEVINGVIYGDTSQNITATEQLDKASNTEISFILNKKYEKNWQDSKASVSIFN